MRAAGFLLACLPVEEGGLWESHQRSTWSTCELLRRLAHGDASVALVAAMHPLVLASGLWLGSPPAPEPYTDAWAAQCHAVLQTTADGAWWGTVISEPGTGGDPSLTRATAQPTPGAAAGSLSYLLTGQKQFGSGSGITSYVIATAIPDGERETDFFFIDMRGRLDPHGVPLDPGGPVRLTAAWDGHGMSATQSHGLAFDEMPATRLAWPSSSRKGRIPERVAGIGFTAVIVGIVEVSVETARAQLRLRRSSLHAFEQTEWARVEVEAWLVQQAYAGMLRAAETEERAAQVGLLGKTAVADLATSVLTRICQVIGGASFSRHAPYGFWLEDVRALGFLRPPWSLAFNRIVAQSLTATGG